MGDADQAIFFADDFAQVDVLDRIVRFRHGPRAAWTVDLGFFHCRDHFLALGYIAFHSVEAGGEEQSRVITLDRVDIRFASKCFSVRGPELFITFAVQAVGVVQSRFQTLPRVLDCVQNAVGQESRAI